MNTLRQLAVHYRGAPSHERMPHPQPGAAPGQGSRPVLHLKPKKNAPAVQASADDAAAGQGAARPEVPESDPSM
jgi:hypothetical protein